MKIVIVYEDKKILNDCQAESLNCTKWIVDSL